jgi:hypothetical protein
VSAREPLTEREALTARMSEHAYAEAGRQGLIRNPISASDERNLVERVDAVVLAALAAREEPHGREWRICRLCWEAWLPGGERNDCVCEEHEPFSVWEIAAAREEPVEPDDLLSRAAQGVRAREARRFNETGQPLCFECGRTQSEHPGGDECAPVARPSGEVDERVQMYNLDGESPELPTRLLAWPDYCTQVERAEQAEARLVEARAALKKLLIFDIESDPALAAQEMTEAVNDALARIQSGEETK